MLLRKSIAVASAILFAIVLAHADAVAKGFGGHGFRPGFGHSFSHDHDVHHFGHHDIHNHHWAMHDFHHWDGRGLGGHFGHWEPGHWHAASGFGGHDHWSSHLQGVWGL
jgi:hypothetical protein